jgi:hypothetical protein
VGIAVIAWSLISTFSRAEDACLTKAPSLKAVVEFQIATKRASLDYYRNLCAELGKETDALKESDIDIRTDLAKLDGILDAQPREWRVDFNQKLNDIKKISPLPEKITAAYDLSSKSYAQIDLQAAEKIWKQIHLETQSQQRAAVLALILSKVKTITNEFGLRLVTFRPFKDRRSVVRLKIVSRGGVVFDLDPASAGSSLEAFPALHQAKVPADECQALFECEVEHAVP